MSEATHLWGCRHAVSRTARTWRWTAAWTPQSSPVQVVQKINHRTFLNKKASLARWIFLLKAYMIKSLPVQYDLFLRWWLSKFLILFEKKFKFFAFCLLLLTSNLNILSVIFFGDSKVATLSMKTLSESPKNFYYLKQKQLYICESFLSAVLVQ